MSAIHPQEAIIVSESVFNSRDSGRLIGSNIQFINAQLEEYLQHEELSEDALLSYYVDYYLEQVRNGGFSQFVYNSRCSPVVLAAVRDGLRLMGALEHLKLFERETKLLDELGQKRLESYMESEYFGENPDRDFLSRFDSEFYALNEREDLIELNANWLRQNPNLVVLTSAEMEAELKRRAHAIEDRDARIAEALARAPRYVKLIRRLCAEAGFELERITAGDPRNRYKGKPILAWYFVTDHGVFYMLDLGEKGLMFKSEVDELICEVDAGDLGD